MVKKKVFGRNITIALAVGCIVLTATLGVVLVNYTDLHKRFEDAKAENQILMDENSNLTASISDLQNQIATLEYQLTKLNDQKEDLDAQVEELSWQKAVLEEQLNESLSENTELIQRIADLENQIYDLDLQIADLEFEIFCLEQEYADYVAAYQNLIETVNQRWNHRNVEDFITPQDQVVEDIVYSITGGWSDTSDWSEFWSDVKKMYNWVVDNIEYRSDGIYPMLPDEPSGNLKFWWEVWQFPSETLSLREGDCEDMAILLCSMIRCYGNTDYFVEVIEIQSSIAGHAAVQIPVSGGKLVILDPAGHYYTKDFWGNIDPEDIGSEIEDWLDYWRPSMGNDVHVKRVFSDYMDMWFSSTEEYISWMYAR